MNELKDLQIEEVSLVTAGANPEAYVTLFKSKEEKNMKDKEALEKKAAEEPAAETSQQVEKKVEDELTSKIDALTEKLSKMTAPDLPAPPKTTSPVEAKDNTDAVAKLEAIVAKLSERLEAQIAKAEDAEFMAIAKKYELLGTPAEELAPLLKDAKAVSTKVYDSTIKAFDIALEKLSKTGIFNELGKDGDGAKPDARTQLEKAAAEIRKAKPELTERQAIDAAFLAHPELQKL